MFTTSQSLRAEFRLKPICQKINVHYIPKFKGRIQIEVNSDQRVWIGIGFELELQQEKNWSENYFESCQSTNCNSGRFLHLNLQIAFQVDFYISIYKLHFRQISTFANKLHVRQIYTFKIYKVQIRIIRKIFTIYFLSPFFKCFLPYITSKIYVKRLCCSL